MALIICMIGCGKAEQKETSLCIFNALSGLHSDILSKISVELDNGNVVRCIIESKSSKYEFEINSDGYQEAVEEMKKHYRVGQ